MSFSPRTFRCLNCQEMINDSMTQCRYCSVPIDPGVAELSADRQQKSNQAYSDAGYLRTAVIAMYVFMGLSVIPILPVVSPAFLITFIVVVVLVIRWYFKFNDLISGDPDFAAARRSWTISLVMMLVATPLGFIVRPIVQAIIANSFMGE